MVLLTPFNYLFYKVYAFYLLISPGDTPSGMSHLGVIWALFACNIITVYLWINDNFPPYQMFVLLILLLPYSFPKVADKIVSMYENESEVSKVIGNIAVIAYIALSIFFLVKVS